MSRVLVVFATRNGSTQQIAEAVATVATAEGAQVQVCPAGSVRYPVTGWDLVVLGAPIYSGHWHREAHRFLKRHRAELGPVPVAVFGSGPRCDEEDAWSHSREQLDRALGKHAWLVPVAVGLFGGADPVGRHGRPGRPRRDLRDWTDVATWTRKVLAETVTAGAPD
jgi:menaquinone-dependent protoporphyrinogen oxidase